MLSWLKTYTCQPATATVAISVSELQDLERRLVDAPQGGKGSRGPRKQKGMTSRSLRRRRPDTAYLAFVRGHPCCSCKATRHIDAHHTGKRGIGQKAPDATAVPLCRDCHRYYHDHGAFPGYPLTTPVVVGATITKLQSEWAELQSKDAF